MIKIYLYQKSQKVLIPTIAQTSQGFFIKIDPLQIYAVSQVETWQRLVAKRFMHSPAVVETPDEAQEPGSAILEALELNSWSEFEKEATLFTLHQGARYTTIYATGHGDDGMWSAQKMTERKFASKAPLDIVLEALIKDIITHPGAIKEPPKALLLGPPR